MNSSSNKILINVVGPTAVGKTSLSVQLAKYFNTSIISSDSRQFYKQMDIGTAKVTEEEMQGVPHFLVDFLDVKEEFSAGKFEVEALKYVERIHSDKKVVIMCGGSGLYINAVLYGLDDLPSDMGLREELNATLEEKGLTFLQEKLKQLDPEHYNQMDSKNPQRVIRALEVCISSGKTYTSFKNRKLPNRPFNVISIGLNTDREILYDRINKRVDIMMKMGLVQEVKNLLPYKHLNALQTVGYQEIFSYLNGEISLNEATELIKKNSRNYAKRQLTWFRKDKSISWFEPNSQNEIINFIEGKIQ